MSKHISPWGVFSTLVAGTEWVQVNKELCERQGYVVRDLPTGEKINFRVMAKNIAGLSPPALLAQSVTIREIMGKCVCVCVCVSLHSHLPKHPTDLT